MLAMAQQRDENRAKARRASIVILVAFLSWMGLSVLGGALGLPIELALALDAACLIALGWAMWTLVRAWRAIRGEE
jgi:predicted branched-subunit amino acid permease